MMLNDFSFALPFRDRTEAGRILGNRLRSLAGREDIIVLALPRGGVPVAAEIAYGLRSPLFAYVVRKLGVPEHEELAMGAITSGGKRFINYAVTSALHISESTVDAVALKESRELRRCERLYCRGGRMPDIKDKIVILVDDGVATGSTMMLVVQALRDQGAGRVIVAVGVAPASAVSQLRRLADEVVCLAEPEPFASVGEWYRDFRQVTDHEVCSILDRFGRTPELQSA
jgi:putative phosphoribosyl transferase